MATANAVNPDNAFLAVSGAAARAQLEGLIPGPGWTVSGDDDAAFAVRPGALSIPWNGGLFAAPGGGPENGCRGVLAGRVFNLDQWLDSTPAELPGPQRLGLLIRRLWEDDRLDRLDGAFALVFQADALVALRDAVGERPLYRLETPDGVVLADRLAPLLRHPSCTRRLYPPAVADYLATGFCPFERTPVEGIRKLPPGHLWEARLAPAGGAPTTRQRAFHVLRDPRAVPEEEPAAQGYGPAESILRLTTAAVEKRLVPEAPSALLLSGGLDSSLVGALAGGERLEAAYSLSFGNSYRNELEFSSLMARHLGLDHRVVTLGPLTVRDHLVATQAVLDEPIGDPLTVPNVLVAQEVARDATLVLNGEGGDPVFGGPKNLPMLVAEAYGGRHPGRNREELYLTSYNKGFQHLGKMLRPEFRQDLAERPSSAKLLAPYLQDRNFGTLLNRLMHTNLRLKGAAQILPKVFKASSAAGLTVASPLFDRALVETAFRLPPELKLRGGREKHILKEAVRHLLPSAILERPKSGMLVPVEHWFRKELNGYAHDLLRSRRARQRGIFEPRAIDDLLKFRAGGVRSYVGDRIWLLISLEAWFQAHDL